MLLFHLLLLGGTLRYVIVFCCFFTVRIIIGIALGVPSFRIFTILRLISTSQKMKVIPQYVTSKVQSHRAQKYTHESIN